MARTSLTLQAWRILKTTTFMLPCAVRSSSWCYWLPSPYNWFLQKSMTSPECCSLMMYTFEKTLSRGGIVNLHSSYKLSLKKPKCFITLQKIWYFSLIRLLFCCCILYLPKFNENKMIDLNFKCYFELNRIQ